MAKDKLQSITDTVAGECMAFRVRLLSRVITAIYDDALRALGLTANQFGLLVVVARMEKATAKEVSRVLLMEASTVSRNLERMRKEGWLRGTPGQDARSQELALTEKGLHLLKKAHPAWRKAQEKAREVLGEKNAAALSSAVGGIWSYSHSA